MFDDLRSALSELGFGPRDVLLPGDDLEPLQGALALRAAGGAFELVTIDYGSATVLRRWDDLTQASAGVLEYVDRPLPAPERPNEAAYAAVSAAASGHYDDLHRRLAGGGSLLIELPPGLALDRIGAFDGVQLFPAGTSVEQRALPPTALTDGAALHRFITAGDVLVRAEVVRPWFGHPGGGLRFTLADDFTGIRDLVLADRLRRVELQPVSV
ncbi:TNT domain-containing protein [Agromyces sp. LHK192]|uniref:TNT domain-containing protein n=1 Tax=Agromyces sp. LHK192 TaxID=2498704 RepID=UPI000FD90204|nr:TNT domain-containing protein [Agromyces sp. LHK192]